MIRRKRVEPRHARYKRVMPSTRLHQSFAMGLGVNVLAVFLAYCAAASALSAQFPRGKVAEYKYYGDVKAGIIEPAAYASQFAVEALLRVKHEISDATLNNAYYISLTDVKTGMHNGVAAHYERTKVLKPIKEAAKPIERPFLVIFDEAGKLQGVKIAEDEPAWSKNMKMAMASMLQLDLPRMKAEDPSKPRSFVAEENTIHGNCWVIYDVHAKDQSNPNPNELVVTKFSSPQNCTGFVVSTFNHVDREVCQAEKEEPVNVASRRVFDIEVRGEELIVKKLIAHGGSNYFPWNSRSEAHYVLNNATFALQREVPVSEMNLPPVNFRDIPITRDLTYRRPMTRYAPEAALDVTQGRRAVDQTVLVSKVTLMLGEAVDYLDENHLSAEEPDWKHGQTINRMILAMSYMSAASLERVYNGFENSVTPREATIKNIFSSIVAEVGTPASCLFTLKAVREQKFGTPKAIEMLTKLARSVRAPSADLLERMEELVKLQEPLPAEVRRAAILSYATMVNGFARQAKNANENEYVEKYIRYFFDRLNDETSYEMRVTYLMAMRNIEFGKSHELLAPIVRGEVRVSEYPMHLRLLAIWAIEKSVERDYGYGRDLLWPIMADLSLPVKIRIAAYEILMHQAPAMSDVLRIYWFMVYEKNEHLYNYHHTTLKGIANTVDPCKLRLRAMARKIMRYTRVHETIRYPMASARIYDFKDEKYNQAQKLRTGVILNELTGVLEVLLFEHTITEASRPFENIGVRVHVEGLDEVASLLKYAAEGLGSGGLTDSSVQRLLELARMDLPPGRKIHVDIALMQRGKIIAVHHWNERGLKNLYDAAKNYIDAHKRQYNLNYQHMAHDELYEKQVTSEMGLPVVFENRVPILASLKIDYQAEHGIKSTQMNFEMTAKLWRHGDYSMSIYNPLADVWHSIRRATATDASLPIRAIVAFNAQTNSLKVTLPRQPANERSFGGVSTHAKDCVTVNDDDADALGESCPTCATHVVVTRGLTAKKTYLSSYESRDTGLRYTWGLFDCENGLTPIAVRKAWYRALVSERKNDWNEWLAHVSMAIQQRVRNVLVSPDAGSCGAILKIQPSIVHSASHVDIGLRGSYEDVDGKNSTYHQYPTEKYSVKATMDVVAALTNVSASSWDLNVNVDLHQGHLTNKLNILLTRKIPDETDFKICMNAHKMYPARPNDPLKLGVTREETNTKLTIAAVRTNEDTCPRDETLVSIKMKAELSDDQKKEYNEDIATSSCAADKKNPLYANPKNFVPKTIGCLEETMKYTTLRKYTLNVAYQKVAPEFDSTIRYLEDAMRSGLPPNLEYTMNRLEPGNAKIIIQYPLEKEQLDLSVVTPERGYDLLEVDLERPRFNGFGPFRKPLWRFPLDNTRFAISYLQGYMHDASKMCSIYEEVVSTGDGKSVPFSLTDQWTLVSGDHVHQRFAIFAKRADLGVALKLYVGSHSVEVSPGSRDGNALLTVDGVLANNWEGGLVVPSDLNTWLVKITRSADHVILQMREIPIITAHAINHVILAIDGQLQGKISGLCGHLNGTHFENTKKFYRLEMTMP